MDYSEAPVTIFAIILLLLTILAPLISIILNRAG